VTERPAQPADAVTVKDVVKTYPRRGQEPLTVLDGTTLRVGPGEFAAVIGPSGCGKSTLLNMLAGLENVTSGRVLVQGEIAAAGRSRVAYMPQKDLLFPWRRVRDNTTLGLEIQGMSKRQARLSVDPLFGEFGLDGFQNAYPAELSGGMRQRAALLRTVVQGHPVLLLDEPFGALDSLTRTEMQLWLAEVWRQHQWTVVLVTHDIREAVFLADTVFVMSARPGRITQRVDVAAESGGASRSRDASWYGSPAMASLEARMLSVLESGRV